jgi:hypothetical protein
MTISKKEELIKQLNYLFSALSTAIEHDNQSGYFDTNISMEDFLCPILSRIFQLKNLKNLNRSKAENYPSIDLGDEIKKVAFQITSQSDIEKIKSTLKDFVKYEFYKEYKTLFVFILTRRQKKYTPTPLNAICEDKFKFDPSKNILDSRDLADLYHGLPLETLEFIKNHFERNINIRPLNLKPVEKDSYFENIFLNALEINFPENLYLGKLNFNKEDLIAEAFDNNSFIDFASTPTSLVKQAFKVRGLKLRRDWVVTEGNLITFQRLDHTESELSKLVELGTVEEWQSKDFFNKNSNFENIFRHLLRNTLSEFLFKNRVIWQHEIKKYIFVGKENDVQRIINWKSGNKIHSRVVFKKTMKNNKNEILNCKHLAFSVNFLRIQRQWHIQIIPDWFFSKDGYNKNQFSSENLKWIKRNEWNSDVSNHFKFIVSFITPKKQTNLYEFNEENIFDFGSIINFESPFLDESSFRKSEPSDRFKTDENYLLA